jgi:chitin synthase
LALAIKASSGIAILLYTSGEADGDRYIVSYVFLALVGGVYLIGGIAHCEVHHLILTVIQYTALLPTFVNILSIYSFRNLHDLSWGTKGLDSGGYGGAKGGKVTEDGNFHQIVVKRKAVEARKKKQAVVEDLIMRRFDSFRTNLLLGWVFINLGMAFAISSYIKAEVYLLVLSVVVGGFNFFRLIGCLAYLLRMYRYSCVFACLLRCGVLKRRHARNAMMQNQIRNSLQVQAEQRTQERGSTLQNPTLDQRPIMHP